MDLAGKKVFVGLSGGVDSAVSAALLTRAGAQVTGVFIKGWYPPEMPCTWRGERQDAMRVAAHLQIPFATLDAGAEYKREVIEYLLTEYALGRTPNPDAMCNREIKFGAFYRYAKAQSADFIATGHYRSGEKDQSYFLALVPGEILRQALFPVGQMDKAHVRALARKFNLPVAEKRESQGVCFLGSVSVKEFLMRELGDEPALLHTVGEKVEGRYVASKQDGKLILSESRTPRRGTRRIAFRSYNPLSELPSDRAQYRYRGALLAGEIREGTFFAQGDLPEYPAPGQVLAFYHGRELVGGGIIDAYAE
ncbi:MAG: hypothetical protein ACREGR_01650 [Minisyncoccia bacterium]